MNSFSSLKGSLAKLKSVNTMSETFESDGVKFTITVLTRREEIDAQAWAEAGPEGLSHVLKMDVSRLSYAVKAIDDVPLPDYIEDPQLETSTQRHIFLREHLLDMPSPLLDALINKYNLAKSKLREKLGMQTVTLESLFDQAISLEKSAKEVHEEAQKAQQQEEQQAE